MKIFLPKVTKVTGTIFWGGTNKERILEMNGQCKGKCANTEHFCSRGCHEGSTKI